MFLSGKCGGGTGGGGPLRQSGGGIEVLILPFIEEEE